MHRHTGIVCFTGGRDRADPAAIAIISRELATLDASAQVIVGDCPSGVDRLVADALAHDPCGVDALVFLAGKPGAYLEGFDLMQASDWDRDGKRAGFLRNEAMIEFMVEQRDRFQIPGRVVAIPGKGPGTRNTIDLAKRRGIPVEVHEPHATQGGDWPPEIQSLLDSGLFLLSASSYKLAKRCVRRWGYKEICRRKEPSSTSTEFGTRGHAQAERFLRDGIAPDIHTPEGRLVYESLPYLPRPGEASIEVPFAFELDGAWFYGRIDGIHAPERRKFDHKFVGSLDYAETPSSLVEDPAAVLYTLAPPVWPVTRLRWIYNLKTRKAGQAPSNPVDAALHVLDALRYAEQNLVPAWRLLSGVRDLFAGQDPAEALPLLDSIPCNPRDCMAFNRPCPHMSYCTRENPGLLEELLHV
jgi:hypothetical protein